MTGKTVRCSPLIPRLLLPPSAAAAVVFLVGGLTVIELHSTLTEREEWMPRDPAPILESGPREPVKGLVPEVSEEEALGELAAQPSRAAVQRLWPVPAHRDRLLEALLRPETPTESRLFLLKAFEVECPERALEGARRMAQEGSPSEPIHLSAYRILARLGDDGDLFLMADRPHEREQVKAHRHRFRSELDDRVHPGD
jgi:hypothetical protein